MKQYEDLNKQLPLTVKRLGKLDFKGDQQVKYFNRPKMNRN